MKLKNIQSVLCYRTFNASRSTITGIAMMASLMAHSASAEENSRMEELIVTAALEPVLATQVTQSITVITREEIEQRQVKFLGELLRDVPGFAVSQSGGPGTQTQVRVRGAEANQLLVLMDGIRANDPASGDEFQFQYASTANIERIEIIRGPQSAIWGTDALAGVINIIRRQDVTEEYIAAEAEYGSFNSLNLAADGGIRRNNYRLSGGVSYAETDGTNISRVGIEDDGARNTNANITFEVDPSDAWKLLVSGQHVNARTEFDDVDFVDTGLPTDADRETRAKRDYVRAEARYAQPGGRWGGNFSVNWLNTNNDNYADGIFNSSTAAESLEFRLRGTVLLGSKDPEDHRLTFALDHDDVSFEQRGVASPFGDPNQNQSYDVMGYAAEYIGTALDGFTWNANARLDDYSDFDSAFTWQLAASQMIGDNWKLRGSAGTGSKAPTFTERFGFYPDFFIGNPDLKPETSRGWEIGTETRLAGGAYRLGITYFDQKLEDEIDGFVFDPNTFLFTAANKEGTSKRRGVEIVLDGQFTRDLSFVASYTYLKATESDAMGNEITEVRRPKHMASFNLNYDFLDDRGNLNTNIRYNGEQFDNFFPPPFFGAETVVLDDYILVDLAGSWELTHSLELVGRISNLFDADYEEIYGFARPGRAFYAGLRGQFDL